MQIRYSRVYLTFINKNGKYRFYYSIDCILLFTINFYQPAHSTSKRHILNNFQDIPRTFSRYPLDKSMLYGYLYQH